jgi:hypothetical protein
MTGRCAGCGLTNKNAEYVREHTRYCEDFPAAWRAAKPGVSLDPVDVHLRWVTSGDRAEFRQERKDAAVTEADRRRAAQKARWATPPDILEE